MKMYSYKVEDLAIFANQVKENLLISLEHDGVLMEGEGVELATTYVVSVSEQKNTWGSMIAEKLGFKNDGPRMVVSKLITKVDKE